MIPARNQNLLRGRYSFHLVDDQFALHLDAFHLHLPSHHRLGVFIVHLAVGHHVNGLFVNHPLADIPSLGHRLYNALKFFFGRGRAQKGQENQANQNTNQFFLDNCVVRLDLTQSYQQFRDRAGKRLISLRLENFR